MGITTLLNSTPLYEYESNDPYLPHRSQVVIGGHAYEINLDEYVHQTVPVRRNAQDTTAQPSDASLSTEGFWVRSATDWTLGAGQRRFDDTELSSQRRFLRSKGINPWVRHELSLLHTTRQIATISADNADMLTVGNYVYWADGANLKFTGDPFATTPTISTCAIGETITAFATDGVDLYIGTPVGIYRAATGATSATLFSDFHADLVAVANGRLFATLGGRVVEVDADGVAGGLGQLDDSTRAAAFRFTAILSAPNGVYLTGVSGDRSQIFYVGVNTQTGEMLPLVWAGDLPDGVTVNAMAFYGGAIIMGTTNGLCLGVISGPDSVIHSKFITELGSVEAVEGQGDFVWCSWSNFDATSTGTARIGMGEFTEPFVPAYASDLMATTQGRVVGITSFEDKRIFAVANVGIYVEDTPLVASGYIESGEISWGSVIRKSMAGLDMRHAPLQGSVEVSLVLEDGTPHPVGLDNTQGSLAPPDSFELFDAEGEFVNLRLVMSRSATDTTKGPNFRRWSMSCFIRPQRQDKFLVPVRLFSKVTTLDGITRDQDTYAEFMYLKSLEQSGALTLYRFGNASYRVQVEAVQIQNGGHWNDVRSWPECVTYVTMTTQEPGL